MCGNKLAKAWHNAGHIVFPLKGKKPLVKWGELYDSKKHPDADGYAVRCDKLLVLDMDFYKEGFNVSPLVHDIASFATTLTPSGGAHAFFHYVEGIKSSQNPRGTVGVDIKTGPRAYVRIYGTPPPLMTLDHGIVDKLVSPETVEIVSESDTKYEIKPYLDKIDADCDMGTWLCVLNAIKNLTGDKALAWGWSSSSRGEAYTVASRAEFNLRYKSLKVKRSKLQAIRYLKRLANAR